MKKIVDKSTGVPLNIVSYTNIEDVYDNDGFGAIPRVYMKKSDYADDVIYTYTQSENTLVGSGSNGKFKATSSGEITSFTIGEQNYTVKQGEETSINLIAGNWYSFILDTTDNTINFSSGGASNPLNFQIVGGTTQPSNPKENTIWINTDTAIGEYQFSSTQPKTRADGSPLQTGDVWIKTGVASNVTFNALKKNAIFLYPVVASQWNGSKWVTKTMKVFIDGSWEQATQYLIYEGKPSDEGMIAKHAALDNSGNYGSGAGLITQTEDYYRYDSNTTSQNSSLAYFPTKINFDNISQVRVYGDMYKGSIGDCRICIWDGSAIPSVIANSLVMVQGDTSKTVKNWYLDTKNISGEHYLGVGLYCNGEVTYANMYEIELIP